MRCFLTSALTLAAVVAGAPAYADCAGPSDCFCSRTSSVAVQVVATVRSSDRGDDPSTAELLVESVHGQASFQAGDTLTVQTWQPLEVGARVLVEATDGQVASYGIVVERDDGGVECSGFSSADLNLSDIIEVRGAEECYSALYDKGAQYEAAPCDDVVTGPFGCSSAGGATGVGWLALGLLALGVRARVRGRRPV